MRGIHQHHHPCSTNVKCLHPQNTSQTHCSTALWLHLCFFHSVTEMKKHITCNNSLDLPPAEWKIESSDSRAAIPPSQLCENRWIWGKTAVLGKTGMDKEKDCELISPLRPWCPGSCCTCNKLGEHFSVHYHSPSLFLKVLQLS